MTKFNMTHNIPFTYTFTTAPCRVMKLPSHFLKWSYFSTLQVCAPWRMKDVEICALAVQTPDIRSLWGCVSFFENIKNLLNLIFQTSFNAVGKTCPVKFLGSRILENFYILLNVILTPKVCSYRTWNKAITFEISTALTNGGKILLIWVWVIYIMAHTVYSMC